MWWLHVSGFRCVTRNRPYNLGFLGKRLSQHYQSVTQSRGLYTMWNQAIFKNFLVFTILPPYCMYVLIMNLNRVSTCKWCTTLVLWLKVYLNMTNQCLKPKDCIPTGSISNNFLVSAILYAPKII